MFGGRIQPINGRVDGTHGLSISDWPGDEDLDKDSDQRIFYSIPMGYIEGLFQMQNWERKHNLKNWKQFHIPRTGALSIHLNCFTTMPWEEEIHDVTSTLAEDLSLSDPDEPARKRRETRTGSPVTATKGYGEEGKSAPHPSKKTELVPPDRPGIKSPTNISAAAFHRSRQAMTAQRNKVKARKRERAREIKEMWRAEQSLAKRKKEQEAVYNYNAAGNPHEFNYRQSIRQPNGQTPQEERTTTTTTTKDEHPSQNNHRSQSQSSPNEALYHPRVRGLKRAANADTFRPVGNWPRLRSSIDKSTTSTES